MDKALLDILVCPVTKGPLIYDRDKQGNRIFYNKAQRKQYLLRLRSEVSEWCE